MVLTRRRLQRLAAGALAAPMLARTVAAQPSYPSQPVRLVVGYAAGQAIDILARLIAQSLAEQFSQQVIVDNKPGAGGNIATEGVARATADGGHTFERGKRVRVPVAVWDQLRLGPTAEQFLFFEPGAAECGSV